jgi:hypothetical protein
MRSAFRSVVVLVCLLGFAPGARAELAAWDQARVAELARQLEAATAALSESMRRQQPPTTGSSQRQPFFLLQHEVRHLRREAHSMSLALQRGAGQEETLPSYESLMRTVRSATDIARRVLAVAELQTRADAAREILNQLAPFYDPNFQPLTPPARR